MHRLIPTILSTPHGELGLFDRGTSPSGRRSWDVARPVTVGWEALGTIETVPGGYSPFGAAFPASAVPFVSDAAAQLAKTCREWDAKNGHPAPLDRVPAHDVGPGGRVYGETGEGR